MIPSIVVIAIAAARLGDLLLDPFFTITDGAGSSRSLTGVIFVTKKGARSSEIVSIGMMDGLIDRCEYYVEDDDYITMVIQNAT